MRVPPRTKLPEPAGRDGVDPLRVCAARRGRPRAGQGGVRGHHLPRNLTLVGPRSRRAAQPLILAVGVHLHDAGQRDLPARRHRTGVN